MRAIRSQGVWDFFWETILMAYTTAQLVTAYTNANLGKAPDAATTLTLDAYATQSSTGGISDATALANTLKLVNNTTAVAVETYQFFTGRAPSAAGLTYLVNSTTNTNDLNDTYYSKFAQENRFINFSINLATGSGEGATAFAAAYGSVSYAQTVATAYDKIIGNAAAAAAGVDVAAAVAYLSRADNITYLTAFVKANTGLTAAADIDLAVKAALIGEILNAATVSGIGGYAKATTALITDLSDGTLSTDAAGGVNILTAYPSAPVGGSTLILTSGTDALTGTTGDDTFVAGEAAGVATLTVGDVLKGGTGTDTLNWVQTAAITTVPTGASLDSIEVVNVTSGGAITLNTASGGFSGVTTLNTNTSGAGQAITAGSAQAVTSTVLLQAATAITVDGGSSVKVAASGVTTGTTTVGGTTAASGDVAVTVAGVQSGAATVGAVAVTGGKTVSVTVSDVNSTVNTTATQSAVTVTGDANTTSVTVSQDKAATASATAAGKANGAVTITDVNAASGTAAGKIAAVTLNSFGAATIDSSALTTVTLSGTGTSLGIGRGALTATPTANTLALNVSGLTVTGAITDTEAAADDGFTTINLASTGTASTIASLVAADATTLNISGDAKVTLTAQTLASLTTVTVTNTAGASLGTALGNSVLFTGGAGADSIEIGATTKAITMGAGNDTVIVDSATLGAGGSLSGGDGTDTLVANVNGSAFSADPAFGGFETLRVAGAAAQGSHNANGFTALEIGATAGATTFTNVAVNVGLTVLAAPTGGTTVTLANATGTSDSFNLTLSSSGALAAGSVTLAGVETVNIAATDTNTTAHVDSLTLVATSAKTVVVTGNAGLTLTNTADTLVTSFDASAVTGTGSAVTYTSANVTIGENVTIKGGAGADVLTGTATANDTISGGAGADTLVYNGGLDVFTGGAGADTFTVGAIGTKALYLTVTDATAGDIFGLAGATTVTSTQAAMGAKITLGAAATLDQYLDSAAAGDGTTGTGANITWFQFGGDTYIVVDNGAGASFTSGADAVIKLTGAVDLSTATLAGEVLTLA